MPFSKQPIVNILNAHNIQANDKARAFELQWNILHFIISISIIVGTFIGEAWLGEKRKQNLRKFNETIISLYNH